MTRLGVIWRIAVGFGLALGAYITIGITNADWAWLVYMPVAFVGCWIVTRTVFRARAQVDEQRRRARTALSRFEADQRAFHAANKQAMLDSPWRQWYLHHEAIGNLSEQGADTLLDHGGSWVREYNDPGVESNPLIERVIAEASHEVDAYELANQANQAHIEIERKRLRGESR